ncbi:ABC transporter permease [Paenirhodobacter populi]|uniref:ABC transporter permease n=1 Tax=Paenirhodobacter populi TaxID=2306993 RepID=A0A443J4K0_9RHOB|nr:ABC transporter permease [Sinirhodobacter populi]RWR15394.1 ABC transporter permease [Sinirhodobacter populi]
MIRYVLRRLLSTIPVMLTVALIVFSILYFSPGDPAALIAGETATAEDVERVRHALGLDRPFALQFGSWLWGVLHFDLGNSLFSNMPVSTMIGQRLEPTLSLMAVTLVFSVLIAVPVGVWAAWRKGGGFDRVTTVIAVVSFSIPVFACGYAGAWLFALKLGWLPVQGYKPLSGGIVPWFRQLILPAASLGTAYVALIARITRASMLETLDQDYIRTARAKGLGDGRILFLHALKNASVPIITIIGIGVAMLIGGAVVTESVFVIPGLGRLTAESILRRDFPVIQGIVLFFSFSYVLVNLLIDLVYAFVDPRIRY